MPTLAKVGSRKPDDMIRWLHTKAAVLTRMFRAGVASQHSARPAHLSLILPRRGRLTTIRTEGSCRGPLTCSEAAKRRVFCFSFYCLGRAGSSDTRALCTDSPTRAAQVVHTLYSHVFRASGIWAWLCASPMLCRSHKCNSERPVRLEL